MRLLLTLRQEHLSSVISNFLGYEGVGSLSAWLRSKEFADGVLCPPRNRSIILSNSFNAGLSVGVSSPDVPEAVYSVLEISVQLTKLGSQVRTLRVCMTV